MIKELRNNKDSGYSKNLFSLTGTRDRGHLNSLLFREKSINSKTDFFEKIDEDYIQTNLEKKRENTTYQDQKGNIRHYNIFYNY